MCLETGTMSALKETGHLEHRLGEHWFQVCRRGAAVGEPPLSGGLETLFPINHASACLETSFPVLGSPRQKLDAGTQA